MAKQILYSVLITGAMWFGADPVQKVDPVVKGLASILTRYL